MKLARRFPLTIARKGLCRALYFSGGILLATSAVFATGNSKPAATARPVARLLSTSRVEVPTQTRPRMISAVRMIPVSTTAPVRAAITLAANGDERRAFDLINDERRARGQKPLILDGELTRMARYHSENMARQGVLNHVDKDGLDTTGRADALGVHGWRALGENIAYNQGYDDPVAFVVERWMHSDKHRDNILNGQFTHAGLGMARTTDGRVFFTQVFMTR